MAIWMLQLLLLKGGLGVPDLELYFAVVHLQCLMRWLAGYERGKGRLIREDLGGLGVPESLLSLGRPPKGRENWRPWPSTAGQGTFNHHVGCRLILPSYHSGAAQGEGSLIGPDPAPWRQAGVLCIVDLYSEGELCTFQDLQKAHDMGAGQFLMYNAITLEIRNIWPVGQEAPALHHGLQCILTHGLGRRAVAVLHAALQAADADLALLGKPSWDVYLGTVLIVKQWEMALK
ncbi:hypothetical protein NDU88_007144 [Pleurodeles waltl]|uniref:Uncharacterized protein n=1 Tax=Pleurodeles waltl TaxID=8319 RepID=A0AAV7RP86_PLEWA|nr:hypothetical protein NDU88_007144 [Pleurodeles waltl]